MCYIVCTIVLERVKSKFAPEENFDLSVTYTDRNSFLTGNRTSAAPCCTAVRKNEGIWSLLNEVS